MPSRLTPLALLLAATLSATLAALPAAAQDGGPELRRVVLANGDVYVGTVADEGADPLVIVTTDGVVRQFRRDQVALVAPLIRGRFYRTDPVKTRLFFAPTARTLGGGEIRGDLAYIFPSVTAGLSDRVDLVGSGFVTFGEGAFATPLVGVKGLVIDRAAAKVALGLSTLFTFGGDTEGGFVAVPYAVATLGDETRAVSLGLGGAFGGSLGTDGVEVADVLILGLGGEIQLSNGVKLFAESLAGIGLGGADGEDATGGEGESGLVVLPGVRFFGNRFAFDVIGIVATDFESVYGFAPIGARASYRF